MAHYYNVELVRPTGFEDFGEHLDSWNRAWDIEHNLIKYAKKLGYTVQGSFTPNDDMLFYKNEEHRLTVAWDSGDETRLTYKVAFEKKLTERDEIMAMVIDYQFTH